MFVCTCVHVIYVCVGVCLCFEELLGGWSETGEKSDE